MNPRGYVVSVTPNNVTVEHKTTRAQWAIGLAVVLGLFLYTLGNDWESLAEAFQAKDLVSLLLPFVTTFFVPGLFAIGLLRAPMEEKLQADRNELTIARRRPLGRWQQQNFAASDIQRLRREIRSGGKSTYPVLTFTCNGKTRDMLVGISLTDAEPVLTGCKALGIDVFNPPDPASSMLKDIEARGWFINPLKPDR